MTLWETQEMEEAAAAAQWEDQNYTPEELEHCEIEAALRVKKAADDLMEAIDNIQAAADWMSHTAMEYKILSFMNDLDNILLAVRGGQRELEK